MIVVGLDHGHGECSATCLKKNNGEPALDRLMMDKSQSKVIPSAIFLTDAQIGYLSTLRTPQSLRKVEKAGPYLIGNDAEDTSNQHGETFHKFKCSMERVMEPCNGSRLNHMQIMAAFLYQLTSNIIDANSMIFAGESRNSIKLIVGCPSSKKWTDTKPKSQYEELILNATLTGQVEVVPESRASMYSGLECEQKKISFSAAEGVMVFDFGSSTADCTYMQQGIRCFDFSWDLGASRIEELMLQDFLSQELISSDEIITEKALTLLRKAKENFFSERESDVVIRKNDGKKLLYEATKDTMDDLIRNSEFCIDSKSGSWYSLCEDFMGEAHRKLANKYESVFPCKTVVLTGGASKMGFIRDLAKEKFPNTTIVWDENNTSYTVSDGLGWIEFVDENYPECQKRIETEVAYFTFEKFALKLRDDLRPVFKSYIQQCAEVWAAEDEDMSIAQFEEIVKRVFGEEDFQPENRKFQNTFKNSISSWNADFVNAVRQKTSLEAQKLFSKEIAAGLNLDAVLMSVSQNQSKELSTLAGEMVDCFDIQSLSNKLVSGLAYIGTLLLSIFFVSTGWIGLAIGHIIGLLMKWLATDDNKDKLRCKKDRQRVCDQIKKQMNNDKTVNELLKQALANDSANLKTTFEKSKKDICTRMLDIATLRYFELTE